jgi:hypothetical protein
MLPAIMFQICAAFSSTFLRAGFTSVSGCGALCTARRSALGQGDDLAAFAVGDVQLRPQILDLRPLLPSVAAQASQFRRERRDGRTSGAEGGARSQGEIGGGGGFWCVLPAAGQFPRAFAAFPRDVVRVSTG